MTKPKTSNQYIGDIINTIEGKVDLWECQAEWNQLKECIRQMQSLAMNLSLDPITFDEMMSIDEDQ